MELYNMPKAVATVHTFLILLLLASCASPDATNIHTHQLFTDHAVLQREIPLNVWGTADPGGTVQVSLGGNSQTAEADAEGKWAVEFAEMEAGGPYELEIVGEDTTIVLQDILIGDVWLASGQSNMEWPLSAQVDNFEEEIANANYPEIRLFTISRNASYEPLEHLDEGNWKQTSPETIGNFSAVAYFFGREIQQEVGVPIGLINSSWGGTPAEAWTSEAALGSMSEFEEEIQEIEQQLQTAPSNTDVEKRKVRDRIFEEANAQMKDEGFTPDFDTEGWAEMQIPSSWEEADSSMAAFDGFVWFQKQIDIPASNANQALTLHLGSIDDADITWFNGEKVGQTRGYNNYRTYEIPASAVQAGSNIITVRVEDNSGNGGFTGPQEEMYLEQNGEKLEISLAGAWKYDASEPLPTVDMFPSEPAILYNAMINPLIPFKIRGVIWYQGESNANRARQYQTLFPLMIEDWRNQWNIGKFPFLFVQLANYITGGPGDESWAELREAQLMALDLDNTGMAVTIDIGDSTDIHPRNKQDVGKRLALAALKVAYDQDNVWSGPMYESMRVEGDSAILTFDEVAEGLMVIPGEKLRGFTIAGANRQFYPATAKIISENEVSVKNPQVANPEAVRYGWANNPVTNLYNEAFLPASPFRTDAWEKMQ
ncbi:sialate O-acetylesterase [Catalinimonas niigatensis]|uniref:sialate O-acetylesterase n=1 Tax=Catalinimonas niigatensis TaxID=1397264 RepID=UPI002666C94F|nr:sialate O-acetylesterase [Catalinimonas niigatensis]WPP53091.1 sialate O-acetylesterase [Catalinimonas niigatensis]